MKRDYSFVTKEVALAALLGNVNSKVIKRMAMYIVEKTTDSNIIYGLLQGFVVNVKINNEEKLAEIIGKYLNETICKITNIEVIVYDQTIRVEYLCKRYAKTQDEIKSYNTSKEQNDVYKFEVEIQDNYRLEIYSFDWEDSLEFEII